VLKQAVHSRNRLKSLDTILGKTDKDEQAEALVFLSRILRLVRDSSQEAEKVGAVAATSTHVEYDPDDAAYVLEMTPFSCTSDGKLSDWAP
jgi:hypothetical protein